MLEKNTTKSFNPSGVGIKNGRFIGLPFEEVDSKLILIPVPWDTTVSFKDGTSTGPENILEASSQLDLYDADAPNAWKAGIFFREESKSLRKLNKTARKKAKKHIALLEKGVTPNESHLINLGKVNKLCETMNQMVYLETSELLQSGKIVGLAGGDHSSPLGYYKALFDHFGEYGILVIDAHLDLRDAYENFKYSHASIYYNTIKEIPISKLVQVGIRDYCDEELEILKASDGKIAPIFDHQIRDSLSLGLHWHDICKEISASLPDKIVISVDIDGLAPHLCPNTGTPVPGGLEYNQLIYLLKFLVESGKKILGFDLCEVAGVGHEWDGNVGARVLYKLACLTIKSQNILNHE
jgi:agmatinase